MTFNIIALVICVLAAAMFIYLRVTEGNVGSVISKTVASFVFVLAGLFAVQRCEIDNKLLIFIPIGLICGMIGDILLELKVVYPIDKKAYFNAGTLSFGIGHIFYAFALCSIASTYCIIWKPLLLCAGIAGVLSTLIMLASPKLNLKFGDCYIQSYIYAFVLSFMLSLGVYLAVVNTMFILVAVGFALFFASDMILSMQYFGGKEESAIHSIANLSTYYAAQILIVAFLMFM